MSKNKSRLHPDVLEYQPDAVEIEESPAPGRIRWTLYLIIFFILAVVIWAIIGRVDRIVSASGKLITTSPHIVVQPLTTSIIREIHVKVGEIVKKDALLVTLDPTFANADFAQLEKRLLNVEVQMRRIDAELQGTTFEALISEEGDGKLQEQLFSQRRNSLRQKKKLTMEKIAAVKFKQEKNKAQQDGNTKQARILREIEGIQGKRPQTNSEYKLKVLEAQRDRFQSVTTVERLQAEYHILNVELQQIQSEYDLWVNEREKDLLELMVRLRNEQNKLIEEINKAKRMSELVMLKAPKESIVLEVAQLFVGSVIRQAEPLITLVPVNVPLEAEVEIKAKDIGRILVGDSVRIKLDAFPFQKYGTLPGMVRVISEDTFQKGTGSANQQVKGPAFYKARIKLESLELRNVPETFRLIPGMKVTTEIKIGKRSVISYFLYPVIRAFDQSIREP